MTRLSERFAALKARGEKALVCFVTAGDPSYERTAEIVVALGEAGADMVEIGIPFSDPLADGPSVQASSQRALEGGMTTRKTLEVVRQVRQASPDLPLILMTYYNPLLRYGLEAYASDAKSAGVDAHIVTDLTPEEAGEWRRISQARDLDTVFLLAPTSTPQRIATVAQLASGFIYCVSRTGVTGARQDVPTELTEVVGRIKAASSLPVCVGFGIARPEHVQRICAIADGAVVGSALVDLIHQQREAPDMIAQVREYVSGLKEATRIGQDQQVGIGV